MTDQPSEAAIADGAISKLAGIPASSTASATAKEVAAHSEQLKMLLGPARPAVTVDTSAVKGQAIAALTGLVRLGGAYLVAHGALTAGQEGNIEPIVLQLVLGTTMAVAGQAVAQLREWLSHHKKVELALTPPGAVEFK